MEFVVPGFAPFCRLGLILVLYLSFEIAALTSGASACVCISSVYHFPPFSFWLLYNCLTNGKLVLY